LTQARNCQRQDRQKLQYRFSHASLSRNKTDVRQHALKMRGRHCDVDKD
jgi:hypothetical protein